MFILVDPSVPHLYAQLWKTRNQTPGSNLIGT